MLTLINRFNAWFDQLQEPKRFLLFMGYMTPAIFGLELGIKFENSIITVIGLMMFSIAVLVGVFRAFGLGGKHRWIGVAIAYGTIALFALICIALGA